MWIRTSEDDWLNLNQVERICVRKVFRMDNNEEVYVVEALTVSILSRQHDVPDNNIHGFDLGRYGTRAEAQSAASKIVESTKLSR